MVSPLLLFAGCVDYGFLGPPRVTLPDIAVSPATLDWRAACNTEPADLTVTNEGDAPLTLTTITVEGGVDVAATALPLVLAPGASQVLSLLIEPGAGLVLLGSDDPDEPVIGVPITAEGNINPVASLLSPYEGQFLPADGSFTLTAIVADTEDAADTLAVEWVSSFTGVVGTSVPDADGFVRLEWPEAARQSGPQTMAVRATDRCGAVGEETLFFCQEGPFTFDALVADAWHTEASAVVDPNVGTLVLGAPDAAAVGAAFDAFSLVNAEVVSVRFRVRATGAVRGFSLTALDGDGASAGWIGGDGCGLGFGGGADCTGGPALPGWSLAFAAANDEGCLAEEHVAWTFDGDVSTWSACAATGGGLYDGAWHDVSVDVAAPVVTVTVDGAAVLATSLDATWAFSAFLGFTAVTDGAGTVEISDFVVTDASCRQ